MLKNLENKKIILGSGSPRRAKLMRKMGLTFEVKVKATSEDYPEKLKPRNVAEYLANKKSEAFKNDIKENEIVITADTIVSFSDQILNKPKDKTDAMDMLQGLSNNMHEVITGVCILSKHKHVVFHAVTYVTFSLFSANELEYYVDKFEPFDKAGAYGIQEWIGLIGVKNINGSFYNVVGLPTNALYHHLKDF